MPILIAFAFLAGIVTVLSPCILPLLPIILSSADGKGKQKPLGVVTGFIASFTFFTLFLSAIVTATGIPADSLRVFSIVVLALFGLSLLIPLVQIQLELLFGRLANLVPSSGNRQGFVGGVIIGLSLGLLWTPCVGPILASVISLAITGTVTGQAFLITLAYAMGTAIPMLAIMWAGSSALQKVPWLVRNTGRIQKIFGVLMILTALGIYLNVDRSFQTYILQQFPGYGVGLTKFEENQAVSEQLEKQRDQPQGQRAPELIAGGQWFNSPALTMDELKGKVVLIDFWTYSCINCQRTMPYLRDWWSKYQDKGLVIIGVHSPEFAFEKEADNVQQAIKDFGLTYPVMQDNDFATWKAYNNHYWPAKYLIDKNGAIRYSHFGEGEYDKTEAMIQQLLKETGATVSADQINRTTYTTFASTPETYLGYERTRGLASPERIVPDKAVTFTLPTQLAANTFAYQGTWTVHDEYAAPSEGAKLLYNFSAKNVYLVARPRAGTSGTMRILVDGTSQAFGSDVKDMMVLVDSDRLYTLVDLENPGQHTLQIDFVDNEVEVFAFTFG